MTTKRKENLRVCKVLDSRTGKVYDAELLLSRMLEQEKHELRAKQLGIDRVLNYACPVCDQKVYLSGQGPSSKKVYHFKHFPNLGHCPLKDGRDLSKDELKSIMYNGAKESDRHKELKCWLGNFLKRLEPHGDFLNINIEKRITATEAKKHWRQPDVSCMYRGYPLVFELQLNGTFVEVIRGREEFYGREHTFICWLFDGFNPADTDFSERDIFWLNKSNAFAITEETMRLSEERGDLLVECHYITPVIEGGIVHDLWVNRILSFSELSLNAGYCKPFYFDSDAVREKLKLQALAEEFTNYFWSPSRKELGNDERSAMDSDFMKRFKMALSAQDLPDKLSFALVNILDALHFLKTNEAANLNRKFSNIKQFTNQILQSYPEHGYIYCMGVKTYRPDFNREQLGSKLKKKLEGFWSEFRLTQAEGRPYSQNKSYDPVLRLLFPELGEYLSITETQGSSAGRL